MNELSNDSDFSPALKNDRNSNEEWVHELDSMRHGSPGQGLRTAALPAAAGVSGNRVIVGCSGMAITEMMDIPV